MAYGVQHSTEFANNWKQYQWSKLFIYYLRMLILLYNTSAKVNSTLTCFQEQTLKLLLTGLKKVPYPRKVQSKEQDIQESLTIID